MLHTLEYVTAHVLLVFLNMEQNFCLLIIIEEPIVITPL